ncbi:MAG: hypothetical protein HYU64_21685 [Armatimonadetes bacterium]|nr:hypothetical protein [Armatimonadota bacterium]
MIQINPAVQRPGSGLSRIASQSTSAPSETPSSQDTALVGDSETAQLEREIRELKNILNANAKAKNSPDALEDLSSFVREHPTLASLLSLSTGGVVGVALAERKNYNELREKLDDIEGKLEKGELRKAGSQKADNGPSKVGSVLLMTTGVGLLTTSAATPFVGTYLANTLFGSAPQVLMLSPVGTVFGSVALLMLGVFCVNKASTMEKEMKQREAQRAEQERREQAQAQERARQAAQQQQQQQEPSLAREILKGAAVAGASAVVSKIVAEQEVARQLGKK